VVKLSIVIPYYNRKQLLINVLKSIDYYSIGNNVELIVVDDGSDNQQQIYDIKLKNLNINLIRIERSTKWRGPCIAYNIGFKAAMGDVIMINSSEVVHMGDVIGYVFKNMTPDKYIAFSTYMANEDEVLYKLIFNNFWGVHSSIGNSIPYCAAIGKEKMDILGGYDERFAKGIGFDDYDFTDRIYNLGLKMIIIDKPFVVHQWHKPTEYLNTINLDLLNYLRINFPDRIKANEFNVD